MHLVYSNVNEAFKSLVRGIYIGEIPTTRRKFTNPNGTGYTLTVEEPMMITYLNPTQRVLFNQARDANPFFHLYESLWMLAGRNDVAPLSYYTSKIATYSDDSKTLNGAYGYRWRKAYGDYEGRCIREPDSRDDPRVNFDQLDILINHLKAQPESRRAVLNMWNVEDDLLKIDSSKDVCCNLEVMFSLREVLTSIHKKVLDMTVTNRSNDLILGMLGANVVHFSFLQEYMAARLGVGVGMYNQFTNNLHVYESNWKPKEWLEDSQYSFTGGQNEYPTKVVPLIEDPIQFEEELFLFVDRHKNGESKLYNSWREPFLRDTAHWMLEAFHDYKQKNFAGAANCCKQIKADDWGIAATQWLERHIKMDVQAL